MMESYSLVISPSAQTDLQHIYQYSMQNWGIKKDDKYLDNLKASLQKLMEHPQLGIVRSEIMQEVRSIVVDSHVIYYFLADEDVNIIRILHARQDCNSLSFSLRSL